MAASVHHPIPVRSKHDFPRLIVAPRLPKKLLRMAYARHRIAHRSGLGVVDLGQAFDLLDVENRVALHVRDFVSDIFAVLSSCSVRVMALA
jgi:hypothetical protein